MTVSFEYKGFIGSAQFVEDHKVYYGKLLNIDNLVTFKARDRDSLNREFREVVEEYLELSEEINFDPKTGSKNCKSKNFKKNQIANATG